MYLLQRVRCTYIDWGIVAKSPYRAHLRLLNYRLGDDIASKMLAFAFGLSAKIERTLISQRTKEALARRKQEGKVLDRPRGSKSQSTKLTGQEDFRVSQLRAECSKVSIASRLGVSLPTLRRFIQVHQLAKRASLEN